jgi:hypothetical protein
MAKVSLATPGIQIDCERSLWLARRIRATPGACWDNAARGLARWKDAPAGLLYVRGIAVWFMPFPHAWLQVGPTIVDPTLALTLSADELREDVCYLAVDTRTAEQITALVKQRALRILHVHEHDRRVPPFADAWQAAGALFLNRGARAVEARSGKVFLLRAGQSSGTPAADPAAQGGGLWP